jgi:hypothetical protein
LALKKKAALLLYYYSYSIYPFYFKEPFRWFQGHVRKENRPDAYKKSRGKNKAFSPLLAALRQ